MTKEFTQVKIKSDLISQLKIISAMKDTTIQNIVNEIILTWIKKENYYWGKK
jgi:hypothetical protein